MTSKVIVLNGISSSGKTSLAKAVQENTQQLYLRLAIDDFYARLPDWFRCSRSERWPEVNLQLQEALFKTVAILAGQGHSVIVDTVLIDPRDLRQCALSLRQHDVALVALHCPLEVAERPIYDLELDTSQHSPEACRAIIQNMLDNAGETGNTLRGLLDDLP